MDAELIMMICMGGGAFLWPFGGWKFKVVRRVVLFLVFGALAIIAGNIPLSNIGLAALLGFGTATLPYGETEPYWFKTLVGISYAAATIPLGFTIWQIILPVIFITTFALSNTKQTASEFPWKVCEAITGILIGIIWAIKIV